MFYLYVNFTPQYKISGETFMFMHPNCLARNPVLFELEIIPDKINLDKKKKNAKGRNRIAFNFTGNNTN